MMKTFGQSRLVMGGLAGSLANWTAVVSETSRRRLLFVRGRSFHALLGVEHFCGWSSTQPRSVYPDERSSRIRLRIVVFTGLVNDVRISEFLDRVGGHFADSGIGMLKELSELRCG